MSLNPYSAPFADGPALSPLGDDALVTPRILEAMRQTRPWITFFAVLGFIATGFAVIGGIGFIATMPSDVPGGGAFGLVYLAIAALYGVGSGLLYRFRTSIVSLERGEGVTALESAIEDQRSFWRFIGISALVVLGLEVLFIGVFVIGMSTMF